MAKQIEGITSAQLIKGTAYIKGVIQSLQDDVSYLEGNKIDYPELLKWKKEDIENLTAIKDLLERIGEFTV